MECYIKSIQEKRGYRQRMMKIWKEKEMFNVPEQSLGDQVRVILRSDWFTSIELEEIKRRMDIQETLLEEGGTGSDNENNVPEKDFSQLP